MKWMNAPSTGKPSVTLTLFTWSFWVAVLKLLLSGLTIGSFTFEHFSGLDFGAVVGALGGIYGMRRLKASNCNLPDDSSSPVEEEIEEQPPKET